MIYGHCKTSEKWWQQGVWHIILEGRAYCCNAIRIERMSEVVPDDDKKCENCDQRLREAGRMKRPKLKVKRDRTRYRPRFTFSDFEEGRR